MPAQDLEIGQKGAGRKRYRRSSYWRKRTWDMKEGYCESLLVLCQPSIDDSGATPKGCGLRHPLGVAPITSSLTEH